MVKTFFNKALKVIQESNLLLEVIDARFHELTRDKKIETIIKEKNKKLIIIVNKIDLISKKQEEKIIREINKEGIKAIGFSSIKRIGIKNLRNQIKKIASEKELKVGVIGLPNTGKSSVIARLSGKKIGVSSKAGFTRGEKFIKLTKKIKLIDSPGVITSKDEFKLLMVNSLNVEDIKDIELNALKLIELIKKNNLNFIEKEFKINIQGKDEEEILEEIAVKKKLFLSGGKANLNEASKQLIRKWQKRK